MCLDEVVIQAVQHEKDVATFIVTSNYEQQVFERGTNSIEQA
jgi:hypothetical protein